MHTYISAISAPISVSAGPTSFRWKPRHVYALFKAMRFLSVHFFSSPRNKMRLLWLAGLLGLAFATPPLTISLQTGWPAPPRLVEILSVQSSYSRLSEV